MITVKELISLLEEEDGNRVVILAADGEGNYFSPLSSIEQCAYRETNESVGEIGLDKLTEENRKEGCSEEDVMSDGAKSLCFWPVN